VNLFKKKNTDTENSGHPLDGDIYNQVGRFVIVTAATNFGLVVNPSNHEPLTFKMNANETLADCIRRSAPFIADSIDVTTCLVVELVAVLPDHSKAVNKIYALILPDPGILINENYTIVGYEQINEIPTPTQSLLQMLVKQVPPEYFAIPKVEAGWHNKTATGDIQPQMTETLTPQPATPEGINSEQNTAS
jgi:hypothetical protein